MIQSVQRAISILFTLKNKNQPLSAGEIAEELGLAKTTVYTIIRTLEANGFLHKNPETQKYRLGLALLELGTDLALSLDINRRSFTPLQQAANSSGRICRVGIWDAGTVFVSMTVYPQGSEAMSRQYGPRIPAYCSALGKAVLAHLPVNTLTQYLDEIDLVAYTSDTIVDRNKLLLDLEETRRRGFSISNLELMTYHGGIGVPIFQAGGKLAGAVSMRLEPEDLVPESITSISRNFQRIGHEISIEMGYRPIEFQAIPIKFR